MSTPCEREPKRGAAARLSALRVPSLAPVRSCCGRSWAGGVHRVQLLAAILLWLSLMWRLWLWLRRGRQWLHGRRRRRLLRRRRLRLRLPRSLPSLLLRLLLLLLVLLLLLPRPLANLEPAIVC